MKAILKCVKHFSRRIFLLSNFVLGIFFIFTIYICTNYINLKNPFKASKPISKSQIILTQANIFKTNKAYYEFSSHCSCRNETIRIVKSNEANFTVVKIIDNKKLYLYNIDIKEFKTSRFTCGMFNILRRGKNQMVHSYSLFNKRNSFYYGKFTNISRDLKTLYPGWLMRIYHDDSIDRSVICEVECAKDNNENFFDNVDFCDVTKMPGDGLDASEEWSADYMHPMKYRWLAAGDSFVDVMTSRDSDGIMIKREVYAVKDWFDSGKYGHIMRDHPAHFTFILGGMGGLYNARDRFKSSLIYSKLIDEKISAVFHTKGTPYIKSRDQDFLSDHVYPIIRDNMLVHDSYFCQHFKDSVPFSTQRQGGCHIGNYGACDQTNGGLEQICPIECRPKSHIGILFIICHL
jgi:hypothetical protein